MSCCTAMMSARGSMTLSIRHSRRPRIFLSIAASSGEKPDSGCSAVRTSSKSARVVADFQPNRMRIDAREPALTRLAGCRQYHRETAMLGLVLVGTYRGLRHGSCIWMSRRRARRGGLMPCRCPVRIGNCEPPQNIAFESAPSPPRLSPARDRIPKDAGSRARQGGQHDGRKACARRAPPASMVS